MSTTTIFITYNPNSDLEETLAIRLHTIGVSGGFRMYLPDRFNSETILEEETKIRISKSKYFVMFSTKPLSNIVKQEIEFAFDYLNDKSRIIVIYDKEKGKNLKGEITSHFTPFYLDKYIDRQDELLKTIINTIAYKEKDTQMRTQQRNKKLQQEKDDSNAVAALLGVGLGLLVLGALNDRK